MSHHVVMPALLKDAPRRGVGRYVSHLATHLADRGHTIEVIGTRHMRAWFEGTGVIFRGSDASNVLYRNLVMGLTVLRGTGIVHCPDTTFVPVKRALTVTTVHDIMEWSQPEKYGKAQRLARCAESFSCLVNSAAVIVPSHKTRADILERWPNRDSVLRVIPNGATGQPEGKPVRPFVLTVGAVEPGKGLETLVECIPRNYPLNWVIAGPIRSHTLRDYLVERGSGRGFTMEMRGFVSEEELETLYQTCWTVVQPSRTEGFGFPIAEALVRGKPVVIPTGSPLDGIAEHAVTFASQADLGAILESLPDIGPSLQQAELQDAQRLQRCLSWSAAAEQTEAFSWKTEPTRSPIRAPPIRANLLSGDP